MSLDDAPLGRFGVMAAFSDTCSKSLLLADSALLFAACSSVAEVCRVSSAVALGMGGPEWRDKEQVVIAASMTELAAVMPAG